MTGLLLVGDLIKAKRSGQLCSHLGRGHGVLLWQEQLELEDASLVRRVDGPADHDGEVPQVVLLGLGADARSGLAQQTLGFLLPS